MELAVGLLLRLVDDLALLLWGLVNGMEGVLDDGQAVSEQLVGEVAGVDSRSERM